MRPSTNGASTVSTRRTGKILWSHTAHQGVPKVKRHVKATQANATPVTNGRVVVVSFGSEGLYAYDMDGKLLWKQDLGILDPGYAGQPELSWGFASSPIIHEDLVILQCDIQKDSFIVAFNITDGTRAWTTERDEMPAWSTPVIYQGKTRTELVTSGSMYYRGYDPLTGRELWRLRDDTQVKVPSPVVAHDLFYLSGGNPRGREFYVARPGATRRHFAARRQASTRSVAWRKSRGSPYTPTPIVYGGYLYVCNDNGVLTVYDALTGAQVYQHRIGTTNSTFSASPIASGGPTVFLERGRRGVRDQGRAGLRTAVGQPDGRAADGDAGGVGRHHRDPRPAAPVRGEVARRNYSI